MAQLLAARKLKAADIDGRLVHGSWRRLVYGQPAPLDGRVERNAYAFCVLTQFHRHLKPPRHLRAGVIAVARPARAAIRRGGVGERQATGAQRAVAAREP
jgi:hypothetical protein